MKINRPAVIPVAALLGLAAPLPADPPAPVETASPAPPATAEGLALFKRRCGTCHATEPGRTSPLGPHLAGIVGRPAASAEFRYSAALRESKLTWTRENLDAYLAAPNKLVPGTRMVVGLPDPTERAAVLRYLASISAAGTKPSEHDHHAGH